MKKVYFSFLPLLFAINVFSQITLPKDHPAAKDLGLLNMKLRTMEPAMEKGRKLQGYDIKNITAHLESCREKAAEKDWSDYERRVNALKKYYDEADATTKSSLANKDEWKNKFEAQTDALKKIFLHGERYSTNPELFNTSGDEYEKAAELFSYEKIESIWEEYKKADPSKKGEMRLPSSTGGSIDIVKKEMDAFIDAVVLKKADKKMAASFNDNKLIALYAAKEALGYANGASKFTADTKVLQLKAEADKRIKQVTKELGTPSGPFHENHIDEIFLSTGKIDFAKASEENFKTSFNYDESVYLTHFLPGELAKITKSLSAKNGYQHLRYLQVYITIDGKDMGSNIVLSDFRDTKTSVCYQLLVIPSEKDMQTETWKKFPVQYWKYEESGRGWYGKSTYTDIFRMFSKLSPGQHTVTFTIGNGLIRVPGSNEYKKEISFTLKGNPDYYRNMLSKLENELLDAVRMSEPFGSNPAIESKIKEIVNRSKGTCQKVIQISRMGIVEYYPEYTVLAGQPKARIQNYEAAYKDADGNCYVQNYYKEEIHMGNGVWQDNGIKQNGGAYRIRCENINK